MDNGHSSTDNQHFCLFMGYIFMCRYPLLDCKRGISFNFIENLLCFCLWSSYSFFVLKLLSYFCFLLSASSYQFKHHSSLNLKGGFGLHRCSSSQSPPKTPPWLINTPACSLQSSSSEQSRSSSNIDCCLSCLQAFPYALLLLLSFTLCILKEEFITWMLVGVRAC